MVKIFLWKSVGEVVWIFATVIISLIFRTFLFLNIDDMKKYCSRAIDICANFLRKQINFIWDMSEVLPMLILWKHSVLLYATNSVKIQFYKEIIKEEKKMSSHNCCLYIGQLLYIRLHTKNRKIYHWHSLRIPLYSKRNVSLLTTKHFFFFSNI